METYKCSIKAKYDCLFNIWNNAENKNEVEETFRICSGFDLIKAFKALKLM